MYHSANDAIITLKLKCDVKHISNMCIVFILLGSVSDNSEKHGRRFKLNSKTFWLVKHIRGNRTQRNPQ